MPEVDVRDIYIRRSAGGWQVWENAGGPAGYCKREPEWGTKDEAIREVMRLTGCDYEQVCVH
jgi:hypothetical protein